MIIINNERQYWTSAESAETYGMWARLYIAVGNYIEAENMHGKAAGKFVLLADIKRATMELDEAITSQRRAGRIKEAQQLFDASIALASSDGKGASIPWRVVEQRSSLFIPVLAGRPFPYRTFVTTALHSAAPSGGGSGGTGGGADRTAEVMLTPPKSATAHVLEDNFEAIRREFEALLEEQNLISKQDDPQGQEQGRGQTSSTQPSSATFNGMHGRDLGLVRD